MNLKIFEQAKNQTILVFGDFILDKYINGSISRISPEAPVPVLNYEKSYTRLGGAGNVINNIISLGANVRALGLIGNDASGNEIISEFKKLGVDTKYLIQDNNRPTINKIRYIAQHQQILRMDEEQLLEPTTEFMKIIKKDMETLFKNVDALVISDYGKGMVNDELCKLLISYSNANNIPIIIDPKGKNYNKYENATICTPNVKELETVLDIKTQTEDDIIKYGFELLKKCNFQYLMLTRSEKGVSLFEKSKMNKMDFPAHSEEVVDVTGVGDTVVATLAVLISLNESLENICKLVNISAGVVVKKFGTSTVTVDEMKDLIEDRNNNKIIKYNQVEVLAKKLHNEGKKISFTNGCFDLLHAGHVDSLTKSKSFGDVLIVAVNSDASVKKYKGDDRPIISEEYRLLMVSSLSCVDYIVLMDDDNASNLIKLIKPDIYVKGADYKNKETPESKIVNSYGGKCKYIEFSNNISTTKIIEKIRNMKDE